LDSASSEGTHDLSESPVRISVIEASVEDPNTINHWSSFCITESSLQLSRFLQECLLGF